MPRFKLTLEYDGSRYAGWQLQKGEKSIQGECMDACRKVFETDQFEFYGAGRTDAGVHALGQVAHLDVKTSLKPEIIQLRVNDQLPHDINIMHIQRVHDQFHARHDAISRSYVYQISTRRNAFGKKYVWWIKDKLDVPRMQKATGLFLGMKNYQSFTSEKAETISKLVEIQHIQLHQKGDLLFLHIVGSHFLWKMVRRITGTLVELGRGKIDEKQIKTYLNQQHTDPARFTAPPSGLFLESIYYPGESIDFQRFRTLFNG
ncbi:MAG: tRNA pseudouridine(38-40) synthase TruA [Saprospiraceae bacterium]